MYTADLNMVQCVSAIVIGFNEVPAACQLGHNFIIQHSDCAMWQAVIKKFSNEGQTVMMQLNQVQCDVTLIFGKSHSQFFKCSNALCNVPCFKLIRSQGSVHQSVHPITTNPVVSTRLRWHTAFTARDPSASAVKMLYAVEGV